MTHMPENVTFLNGGFIVIGDTAFVGANGWYDFRMGYGDFIVQYNVWRMYNNDSRYIKFLSGDPEELAKVQASRMVKSVGDLNNDDKIKNIVMITHTVPVKEGIVFKKDPNSVWNALNGAYANSKMQNVLAADANKLIKIWVFGHTHYHKDFMIGGIHYLSNPRGYAGEARDGEPYKGLIQVEV